MSWHKDRYRADLRKIWHWSRKQIFKALSMLLFWLPRREVNLGEIKKLLIVIVGKYGIGDVVLCTPGIRALKENLGATAISILIDKKNAVILEDCPFIDQLLIYDKQGLHRNLISGLKWIKQLRKFHFDLAVDFYSYQGIISALLTFLSGAKHRIGRDTDHRGFLFTKKIAPSPPHRHQIDRILEIVESLGIAVKQRQPEFFFSQQEWAKSKLILSHLDVNQNEPFIIIHPGTGHYVASARKWRDERFAQLADRIIHEFSINVIFTGSEDEIVTVERIRSLMRHRAHSVAGRCSIKTLAALIQQAKLFISGNTGPMHIAVAVGTPTVSIFSHIDPDDHPDRWKPRGANHIVIQKYVGCHSCERRKCQTFRCLDAVTVDDVFEGVKKLLNNITNMAIIRQRGGSIPVKHPRKLVTILGVNIDIVTPAELIERINILFDENDKSTIFYVNPDCLNKAYHHARYRAILNSGSIVYADGIGVVLAGRLSNQHLPCRITAIDIFHQLCEIWQHRGVRLYLLGASQENIQKAKANLQAAHSKLRILGHHHGYFRAGSEERRVIEEINAKSPDMLLVGLGAPRQELWVHQHLQNLNTKICWCVGGLFDLLSGNLKRGPKLLHQNNFEWMCRLMITPRKVWKRYLIGNPLFLWRVIHDGRQLQINLAPKHF